jgi:hypothetical protein
VTVARALRRIALLLLVGPVAALTVPVLARAQAPSADEEFAYPARAGDTLIGIGQRLLLEPRRWHELKLRNHIGNPRRIPRGSVIRIPYAWLRMTPETAAATAVAGTVTGDGRPVTPGEALAPGTVLKTGADGSVTLTLADGSVITLQKSSVLRLEHMEAVRSVDAAHDIRLKLESGRLDTVVKPQRDVGRFEIVTPVALSAVRGTQFRAAFDADDQQAKTETLAGSVGVRAGSNAVLVPAGFGTRVDHAAPPLPPVALLPPPDLAGMPATHGQALLQVAFEPVAGAQRYRIQLAPDPDFHSIAADTESTAPLVRIADLPDGRYWLRVRSIDRLGLEGPDAVRALVQHTLPDPPQPTMPPPAARLTGTQARFEWLAQSAGTHYRLQLARDPAFADLAAERSDLSTPEVAVEDLPPGRYYWHVAAVNSLGESGAFGEVQSFTQRATAPQPAPPTLAAHELHFEWAPQPDLTYRIQIARDARFERVIAAQALVAPRLSLKAPFPGTYYARVQTVDPDGTAGPFGPVRQFEVPIPLWVRILVPLALLAPLL